MSAFKPQISTLKSRLAQTTKATDPMYQAYSKMLAGMPTSTSVGNAYATALSNTVSGIGNQNFNAGSEGASAFASALAGALGLGGAGQDVAASLQPGAENSLVQQAMRQGAATLFSGAESQAMSAASKAQQEAMLGQATAAEDVKSKRQEIAAQLADVRAKRTAAMPSPLQSALQMIQYKAALADLKKKTSGGKSKKSSSSSSSTTTTPATSAWGQPVQHK